MSPDFLIAGQAVMYPLTDCQLSVAGTSTEHYEVALHPWLQIPAGVLDPSAHRRRSMAECFFTTDFEIAS